MSERITNKSGVGEVRPSGDLHLPKGDTPTPQPFAYCEGCNRPLTESEAQVCTTWGGVAYACPECMSEGIYDDGDAEPPQQRTPLCECGEPSCFGACGGEVAQEVES